MIELENVTKLYKNRRGIRNISLSVNKGDILTVGSVRMDQNAHTVMVDGSEIELTYKEFELLRLFMNNTGIVFSRDKLLSEVWGTDFLGESRTVDMHIKLLRQKLGEAGAMIKTVRGVGYKLEAETA